MTQVRNKALLYTPLQKKPKFIIWLVPEYKLEFSLSGWVQGLGLLEHKYLEATLLLHASTNISLEQAAARRNSISMVYVATRQKLLMSPNSKNHTPPPPTSEALDTTRFLFQSSPPPLLLPLQTKLIASLSLFTKKRMDNSSSCILIPLIAWLISIIMLNLQ